MKRPRSDSYSEYVNIRSNLYTIFTLPKEFFLGVVSFLSAKDLGNLDSSLNNTQSRKLFLERLNDFLCPKDFFKDGIDKAIAEWIIKRKLRLSALILAKYFSDNEVADRLVRHATGFDERQDLVNRAKSINSTLISNSTKISLFESEIESSLVTLSTNEVAENMKKEGEVMQGKTSALQIARLSSDMNMLNKVEITEVDMPLCDLSVLTILAAVVYCSQWLQKLTLDQCMSVNDDVTRLICRTNCAKLTSISLGYTKITNKSILNLAAKFSQLEVINLSGCFITDESITTLTEKCSNLSDIDLERCSQITNDSIAAIATNCHNNLKVLNVKHCSSLTWSCLVTLSEKCYCLEKLSQTSLSMENDDDSLISICKVSPKLQHLEIGDKSRGQFGVTDELLTILSLRCQNLQHLNLGGSVRLTNTGLIALSQGCHQLRYLDLSSCGNYMTTGQLEEGEEEQNNDEEEEGGMIVDDGNNNNDDDDDGDDDDEEESEDEEENFAFPQSYFGVQTSVVNNAISNVCSNIGSPAASKISDHGMIQEASPDADDAAVASSVVIPTTADDTHSHSITDEGIIALVRTNPLLHTFILDISIRVTDLALHAISESCPLLERIEIVNSNITDEGFVELCVGCSLLKDINISGCKKISHSSLLALPLCLENFGIAEVNIMNDYALIAISSRCPKLKAMAFDCLKKNDDLKVNINDTIDIRSSTNSSSSSSNSIVTATSKNKSASNISNKITANGVSALAKGCPLFDSLDLSVDNNDTIDYDAVRSIGTYFPKLKEFAILDSTHLTNQEIQNILQTMKYIETLSLIECKHLSTTCIQSIVHFEFASRLQFLDISGCKQITDNAVIAIVKNCSFLETLKLSNCVKVTNVAMYGISVFAQQLSMLTLDSLHHISEIGVFSLMNCKKLVELVIRHSWLYFMTDFFQTLSENHPQFHAIISYRGDADDDD